MDRFGCLASLPSFLAESEIGTGAFSSKARLEDGPNRERQRRYLASHRYDIEPGRGVFAAPGGGLKVALEVALSLVSRGLWTLPSWRVEQTLAERAQQRHGWAVDPVLPSGSGDLILRLTTRLRTEDSHNVLVPSPLDEEQDRADIIRWLCDVADDDSPGERTFVREVAGDLPLSLLCMFQAQRDVATLGLDPTIFADQRVDFSLETPQGVRLVVEIDGSQHVSDAAQVHLDEQRDTELARLGWSTWRIPTDALSNTERLRDELRQRLSDLGYRTPDSGRNVEVFSLFWSATAIARVQALIIEAMLEGVVPVDGPIQVSLQEYHTDIADIAIADLNDLLARFGQLYKVAIPEVIKKSRDECALVVDVNVMHPLLPPVRSDAAVAWSRPAARLVSQPARRIEIGRNSPRFMPVAPDESTLDSFIRDLFRKDGFRRDGKTGHSDQVAIASRILQGQDVVGLLPTGAGKSLPYMLAGLLLPGMTLYVGPLISLLQDQAERLRESGIGHVEYISSAQGQDAREDALARVQSEGIRFLLVSPERFLTAGFLEALKNRELWRGDISQIVIDECHCVSEWGHEFRPAYLSLGRIAKDRSRRFGAHAPLVALTGTASTVVLSDVLRELGITDSEACVRAANLDRPELAMRCTPVLVPSARETQVEASVRDHLREHENATDGLLIFCPFKKGRTISVFSVAAHLSRNLPGIDVRFYCGGDEPWADYAVYRLRRKATDLTKEDLKNVVPAWARTPLGNKPWPEVKSAVQRDFISGTKKGFRVLVSTKAFGMGIDKPSIRKVIHVLSPTSPEAFYQEIGRAGRDRQASEAELMFCDINPEVTNRLLDPGLDHEEVMETYEKFVEKDRFGGGDFLRTFYFHGQAFQGMEPAVRATYAVVRHLHKALSKGDDLCIPFQMDVSPVLYEKDVEYGLIRLIHLGVVQGYLKDYNRNVFNVEVTHDWLRIRSAPDELSRYLADHFLGFINRYHLKGGVEQVERIRKQRESLSELYDTVSRQMMIFVYQQLERQRRAATRAMLEIARIGATSGDQMRTRLLNYLQVSVRFTAILEGLAPEASPIEWIEVLEQALSPQDLAELHGAAQRVLASFPTHPGLLFLSGVSRPIQTDDDPRRSAEEFVACIRHAEDGAVDMKEVLQAFQWFESANLLQKTALRVPVARIVGRIHLELSSEVGELTTSPRFQ